MMKIFNRFKKMISFIALSSLLTCGVAIADTATTSSSKPIGVVVQLKGDVGDKGKEGGVRTLHVGDSVYSGDFLIITPDATACIKFDKGDHCFGPGAPITGSIMGLVG